MEFAEMPHSRDIARPKCVLSYDLSRQTVLGAGMKDGQAMTLLFCNNTKVTSILRLNKSVSIRRESEHCDPLVNCFLMMLTLRCYICRSS